MAVPDLAALEALVAVAEGGSISATARRLGLSQQTVSARIRTAERTLGVEVLLRTPRGVSVTPSGELVLAWAGEVLAAADRLTTGVRALRGEEAHTLRIAASQTVAGHLLPAWLVRLRTAQEEAGRVPTEVQLRTENSVGVAELVRSGATDLGFIESPRVPADLASTTVAVDRLVLVVAPTHPWAERAGVPLDEVADEPLVTREVGSGTRVAFEDAVRQRLGRDVANPAVELSTAAAVRSAIGGGIAPGVLSELAVADDIALGRLVGVPFECEPLRRPLTALWRGARRDLTPTQRELIAVAVAPAKN